MESDFLVLPLHLSIRLWMKTGIWTRGSPKQLAELSPEDRSKLELLVTHHDKELLPWEGQKIKIEHKLHRKQPAIQSMRNTTEDGLCFAYYRINTISPQCLSFYWSCLFEFIWHYYSIHLMLQQAFHRVSHLKNCHTVYSSFNRHLFHVGLKIQSPKDYK